MTACTTTPATVGGRPGLLVRFQAPDRESEQRIHWQISLALPSQGIGIVKGICYPDGTWWVPEGTDLSGIFENWPQPERPDRAGMDGVTLARTGQGWMG